eukprot:748219-Hanusia_phi.AAC.1
MGVEEVGHLDVPVDHPLLVHERHGVEQLQQQALDLPLGEGRGGRRVEEARQVVIAVLEHEEDAVGPGTHRHVDERDDVGMAETAEERDLSESGEGEAFLLLLHPDPLQRSSMSRRFLLRLEHFAIRALPPLPSPRIPAHAHASPHLHRATTPSSPTPFLF